MRPADLKEFKEVMRDAREAIGQGEHYTDGALELMFAALAEFDLPAVQRALVDHINSKDGRWRPNASYIRAQISARFDAQWISADEAWAKLPIAPRRATRMEDGRMDYRGMEPAPALLNQVTAEALAVAQPQIDAGEETGARMAFKAAYARLVERAKAHPDPAKRGPAYFVSPGGTYDEQLAVRDEGVRLGLLAAPPADAPLLEHKPRTGAKPDLKALLLTLQPKAMIPMKDSDYE